MHGSAHLKLCVADLRHFRPDSSDCERARRYRDQRDRPDLTNPESLQLYLETRFEQLKVWGPHARRTYSRTRLGCAE